MRKKTDILAEAIWKEYIYCGLLKQAQPLPSIRALHAQFGGSHSQIIKALQTLCDLGITAKRADGCCVLHNTDIPFRSYTDLKIGLIIMDSVTNNMGMKLLEGVRRKCAEYGCMPLTVATNGEYEKEQQSLTQLVSSNCAGAIILPTTRTREQIADDYLNSQNLDYPIVLVDQTYPHQHRPQVVFDNEQAGYDITSLLISAGHRRIAFMDSNQTDKRYFYRRVRDRRLGYVRALRAAGISPDPTWSWSGMNVYHPGVFNLHLRTNLKRWAKLNPEERPTAILAADDFAARLIIDILAEMGLEHELMVTGFDNLPQYHMTGQSFPTTNPDVMRAGEIAVDLLLKYIDGLISPSTVVMMPVPIVPHSLQIYASSHHM